MKKLDINALSALIVIACVACFIATLHYTSFERHHAHDWPHKERNHSQVAPNQNDVSESSLISPLDRDKPFDGPDPRQSNPAYTDTKSLEHDDHKAQVFMAIFTFLGLFIGVAGLIMIWRTLVHTGEASNAATITLGVARETLDEAKVNSKRELRAYLKVEVDILNIYKSISLGVRGGYVPARFRVEIGNCGSTPAIDTEIIFRVSKYGDEYLHEQRWSGYGDGVLISPDQGVIREYETEGGLLEMNLRERLNAKPVVLSDDDHIKVTVCITYSDIFGARHTQKCDFAILYSSLETAPKTIRRKIRDDSGAVIKDYTGEAITERVPNIFYVDKSAMFLMASNETTEEHEERQDDGLKHQDSS